MTSLTRLIVVVDVLSFTTAIEVAVGRGAVVFPRRWPDPEAAAIISAYRKEIGVAPRQISDEEIIERLIYALVNEAAYILEEGIALRASDIDMVYLAGYGFPMYRGGPMFYADTVGLPKVLATIEKFQKGYQGAVWKPAPLLVKLTKEGKRFNA